ncbi:hypothetical protein QBC38DRAFT_228876 [Podospora fimiseda]|uniref:Uncharacterized protein n=1 Tax=Podospora fimiseda TaxID=252190 RepID=A0AAN7BNB6_9PEZI|nr:hypothetical protein QBC38DRAFT_228876 [Podospora fimiseda]
MTGPPSWTSLRGLQDGNICVLYYARLRGSKSKNGRPANKKVNWALLSLGGLFPGSLSLWGMGGVLLLPITGIYGTRYMKVPLVLLYSVFGPRTVGRYGTFLFWANWDDLADGSRYCNHVGTLELPPQTQAKVVMVRPEGTGVTSRSLPGPLLSGVWLVSGVGQLTRRRKPDFAAQHIPSTRHPSPGTGTSHPPLLFPGSTNFQCTPPSFPPPPLLSARYTVPAGLNPGCSLFGINLQWPPRPLVSIYLHMICPQYKP